MRTSGLIGLMGVIAGLLVLGVVPDNAYAQTTITFNGFTNGDIVTSAGGATFSVNVGPFSAPVIFDSQIEQGQDPDLNGPPWAGGNLVLTDLGNLLIIQENDCDPPNCSPEPLNRINVDSDDRAAGGTITVDFQGTDMCSWRTALIDIGDPNDNPENGDFAFYSDGGGIFTTRAFEDLDGLGPIGNRFANTFDTLTSTDLGQSFDKVDIIFDGSGAVDNITFEECDVIGGHGKVMDKTALLVSGAQLTSSWMIPLLLSSIGIGVFVVTRK